MTRCLFCRVASCITSIKVSKTLYKVYVGRSCFCETNVFRCQERFERTFYYLHTIACFFQSIQCFKETSSFVIVLENFNETSRHLDTAFISTMVYCFKTENMSFGVNEH